MIQEQVGLSDHSMVIANFSCSFRLVLSLSIGRVSWSHHDLWESALGSMSQLLLESSTAAKAAREELEAASCMPAKLGEPSLMQLRGFGKQLLLLRVIAV